MTIAEKLLTAFESIEIYEDDNGQQWLDDDQLAAFCKKAFATAVEEANQCPQSSDPSNELLFEDGSKLYIGNPGQDCFIAFAYVVKE